MIQMTPGEAVHALRTERGWSQAQLAEELGLRSKGYICDIEKGAVMSRPLAVALYRKFNVKVAPIDSLSDAEIDMLERLLPQRGRAS